MNERYPRPLGAELRAGEKRELSRLLARAINESTPRLDRSIRGKESEMYTRSVMFLKRKNKEGVFEEKGIFLASRPEWSRDPTSLGDESTIIGNKFGLIVDGDVIKTVSDDTSELGNFSVYSKARELRKVLGKELMDAAGPVLFALAADRGELSQATFDEAWRLGVISMLDSHEQGREQIYFPDRILRKVLCIDQPDKKIDRDEKIAQVKQLVYNNDVQRELVKVTEKAVAIEINERDGRKFAKIGKKEIEMREDTYVNGKDFDFDVSPLQSPQVLKGLAEIKQSYKNREGKQGRRDDIALIVGRFQPPHLGHLFQILAALEVSNNVVIGLGSANPEINAPDVNDPKAVQMDRDNPFPAQERASLLAHLLIKLGQLRGENLLSRVRFIGLNDVHEGKKWHNDDQWYTQTLAGVGVPLDVLVANDGWVKKIFEEKGHHILSVPFLTHDGGTMYRSTAIREELRKERDGRPPILAPSGRHRFIKEQ